MPSFSDAHPDALRISRGSGSRNNFRGEGYFGIDTGLALEAARGHEPEVCLGSFQRNEFSTLRREHKYLARQWLRRQLIRPVSQNSDCATSATILVAIALLRSGTGANQSEGRWGIHPENGGRFVGRVEPPVATIALEPETIAPFEEVALDLV